MSERLPAVGSELRLFVCAECGNVEATTMQAGSCPQCGSTSLRVARATATITSYVAGDYWTRDPVREKAELEVALEEIKELSGINDVKGWSDRMQRIWAIANPHTRAQALRRRPE